MWSRSECTHIPSSLKAEQHLPRGDPGIPPFRLHQRPLWKQVEVVYVVLLDHHLRPCVDKKPAVQNSGDKPGLKETATDCGSLVASNRLFKARLGHQLTSGRDPEGEDSRATDTGLCWDEFPLALFRYLWIFVSCIALKHCFFVFNFVPIISLFLFYFMMIYLSSFIIFVFILVLILTPCSTLLLFPFAFILLFLIFVLNLIFSLCMPCFYFSYYYFPSLYPRKTIFLSISHLHSFPFSYNTLIFIHLY